MGFPFLQEYWPQVGGRDRTTQQWLSLSVVLATLYGLPQQPAGTQTAFL